MMAAELVPFPNAARPRWARISVGEARDVVARPDLHGEAEVLDACDILEGLGDWMDAQRAHHLRLAVLRDAVAQLNRKARRRARLAAVALVMAAALVALAVTTTVAASLRTLWPSPPASTQIHAPHAPWEET